ncbi:hypothetical protein DF186_22490, partial [Enterococcus hirae]
VLVLKFKVGIFSFDDLSCLYFMLLNFLMVGFCEIECLFVYEEKVVLLLFVLGMMWLEVFLNMIILIRRVKCLWLYILNW